MNWLLDKIAGAAGFDWDEANLEKNWEKHGVRFSECEEVFFSRPLWEIPQIRYSPEEERFGVLGRTTLGRPLAIVFTFRGTRIRVISARDMSRKERQEYLIHEEG